MERQMRAVYLAITVASALAGNQASAALITFSDSAFNAGAYDPTPVYRSDSSVTPITSFAGGALSTGFGRLGTASWTGAAGFLNESFVYDPSAQGQLLSIDASVDKLLGVLVGDLNGYTNIFGNSFRPLIEQGGQYFMAQPGIAGTPLPGDPGGDFYANSVSGTIAASGLLASNFLSYDFGLGAFGSLNPNFSGGQMRFGLGQISTTGGLFFTNSVIGASYDNLRINLHTVDVPEPGSLSLLGGALLAGAWVSRRKRRNAQAA
jgi:hypothetical protein